MSISIAVDLPLIDDLHDIAIERETDGYKVEPRLAADGNLEAVMVFLSPVFMFQFKFALP